jgi:glycosyltransferase involved in cell wall biosynthesis
VIPAYQEAARIGEVLDRVTDAQVGCQVVVVDDGSRDGTGAIASARGATVLRHPFNLGYGAALQTGYKYALACGAEIVVQMDADGQHDPADIEKLVAPLVDGELDLVVGSRFLEDTGYEMSGLRSAGRLFFLGVARLLGLRVSDPTSGFQAMNRSVLEVYAADVFPTDYPDVDVLLLASHHHLAVGERAVTMRPSVRRSTLHGGLRSFYYVYKMLLSTLSVRARPRRTPPSATEVPPR